MSRWALGAVLALLAVSPSRAASYEVKLSTTSAGIEKKDPFSCYQDKVYAFLTLPQKIKGNHVLEGKWFKPDHALQEDTKIPLDLSDPRDSFFLWLEFHVVDDAVDMFLARPLDDFNGDWTLVLYLDGKEAAQKRFSVRCG